MHQYFGIGCWINICKYVWMWDQLKIDILGKVYGKKWSQMKYYIYEKLARINAFTFQYTPLPPKQFDVHLLFWCFIYHMKHCG
jgi:hypothetical protein